MAVTATDTHRAIEAVWRIESARLIASLARVVRDVGRAEELAQDALVAALEQWPVSGVPDNPAAWLMATAKHRAIDQLRRRALHARKEEDLTREIEEQLEAASPAPVEDADQEIGDDLLRLVFTACHPVLATEARVALTLRLLGGLTTAEIARAFLVAEPTIAQRIVRAKRALADARVPFEVPRGEELAPGWRQCWRSSTSSSTRAMRRRPVMTGCGRVVRGCPAARSDPGRARARRTGGSRSRRVDGDTGIALGCARRAVG